MVFILRESEYCVVLDSACLSTVCGKAWFEKYLSVLDDKDKTRVQRENRFWWRTWEEAVERTSTVAVGECGLDDTIGMAFHSAHVMDPLDENLSIQRCLSHLGNQRS